MNYSQSGFVDGGQSPQQQTRASKKSIRITGDASNAPLWKLSANSEDILINNEFASTIAALATNKFKEKMSPMTTKKYPSFKKLFMEDPKYNPPIAHGHICYVYDAQFKEMEKHWSKSGKKFSDEPRIAKQSLYESPGGPNKPEAIEHVFEKPEKYYGRARDINMMNTNRVKQFKQRVTGQRKLEKIAGDEATEHLGPGTYDVPDVWVERYKPVCGVVQGSPMFASRSSRFGFGSTSYQPKVFPDGSEAQALAESSVSQLLHHGSDSGIGSGIGVGIGSGSVSQGNLHNYYDHGSVIVPVSVPVSRPVTATAVTLTGTSSNSALGRERPPPLIRPPKLSAVNIENSVRFSESSICDESYGDPLRLINNSRIGSADGIMRVVGSPCKGSPDKAPTTLPATFALPSPIRGSIPIAKNH